jgi:hypothetical protein
VRNKWHYKGANRAQHFYFLFFIELKGSKSGSLLLESKGTNSGPLLLKTRFGALVMLLAKIEKIHFVKAVSHAAVAAAACFARL